MSLLDGFGRLVGVRKLFLATALSALGACALAASASAATVAVTLTPSGLATTGNPSGSEFSPQVINAHPGDSIAWAPSSAFGGGTLQFVGPICQTGGSFSPGGLTQTQPVALPSGNAGGAWTIPANAAPGTYYFFDPSSTPCTAGSFTSNQMLPPNEGELVLTPATTGGTTTGGTSSGTPGASLTATVSVAGQFKSVTLSANSETFGNCSGGSSTTNTIGFPNGTCTTPAFTVANNGSVSESIDFQGTNAKPSDNGTPWSLMGAGTPGIDQYQLESNTGQLLGTTAAPDNVAGTLQPNTSASEILHLVGPSSSSDPSPTFSTTATWTAL